MECGTIRSWSGLQVHIVATFHYQNDKWQARLTLACLLAVANAVKTTVVIRRQIISLFGT
eukprot:COSAG02_NODE_32798_length_510_cov_1.158151_1_plen_59_part_10